MAVVVFPTPPFWLATLMILAIVIASAQGRMVSFRDLAK